MVTVIPDVKVKINELILQWLSDDKVLDQLNSDLSLILKGKVPEIVPSRAHLSRSLSPPHHKHPVSSPRSSPRVSSSASQKSLRRPAAAATARTPSPGHSTLTKQPSTAATPKEEIPPFYFPFGKPASTEPESPNASANTSVLEKVKGLFAECPNGSIQKKDFGSVTKAVGFPLYWKCPFFEACSTADTCSLAQFTKVWDDLKSSCHDEASQFVRLLSKGAREYLVEGDFKNLIQDVIDTHPGMTFLDDAPEFHARYIETVTARIFYSTSRSWKHQIGRGDLREGSFLKTMAVLEDEPDINQVSDYFSYEHFYVIYCKFWEIDLDHNLEVSLDDMKKHADGTVNPRAIERLFQGTVTQKTTDILTYSDFIRFLLAEEDKSHPTAIEYWFRVMDIDGDGYISLYELEYFYQAQLEKMRLLGVEECSILDCICQALDLVRPKDEIKITLSDIKKCKQPSQFFNIFLNIQKFLDHEMRDPFSNKEGETPMTDWEKYAAREYDDLIADEEYNKGYDYEDDFEEDEEEDKMILGNLAKSAVETYTK